MRVKFESNEYQWLAVRERPSQDSRIVRKIEVGLDFDVDDEQTDGWRHVTREPQGYVMAKYVTPCEVDDSEDGALQKMTVAELRKLAKDSGVKLKAGLSKAKIIEAILNG